MHYQEIIDFWFVETTESQWWKKDDAFDQLIKNRFTEVHRQAALGELFNWRREPLGRLAEIIILDQFSRNMFRNTPESFTYDSIALVLAQEAISIGADQTLPTTEKSFLYMPYMHSESLAIHEVAVSLFTQPGMEATLDFEHKHKVIIEKFGRYPHRNNILNRESSAEEIAFLKQPNSGF